MKTLADEILEALPALIAANPVGASVDDIATLLYAPAAHVRAAMVSLHESGRASLARWPGSKRRYLVPVGFDFGQRRRACLNCHLVFGRPPGSKRVCCTRSCSSAWAWTKPGEAERRGAAIRVALTTPEARLRQDETNRRRWSDPEQHLRLSEQNRQCWADPVQKAKRSASIQAVNGSPEKRAEASAIRSALWADPEYRERAGQAVREARARPDVRAKASAAMKRRWADPAQREKMIAATAPSRAKATAAVTGARQSPEHVARRVAAVSAARRGSPKKQSPEVVRNRVEKTRATKLAKRTEREGATR